MSPKVTVVTVTYNAADCVEMTLKSVIAQTYSNLEYIVVDGNSTDSTMKIVERYRERINTIISEPDTGIYDAMNKGTRLATGEWIIFMNAGDVFDNPNVLQNIFTREMEENCSLIFGAVTEYSLLLRVKHVYPAHIASTGDAPFPYREHIPCSHQATFYRTKLLKQHPYRNEEFKISADWASMADILDLKLPYHVVDEKIAWYQGGGISSHLSFALLHERERICGYSFSQKDKIKMILLQRVRKFIIRLLPCKISTEIRRRYFIKKLGFIELTKDDIKLHLWHENSPS